jgi:hypothetical protein
MDFRAEATIEGPREAVYKINRDKLVELVDYLPNVRKIEVTSREEKDGKIKLVNVWHGGGDIPAAVRGFLSEGMLSWTDYAEWEQASWTVKWKSESHSFKNAVDSRGHNEFIQLGTTRSMVRIIGKIDVDATKVSGVPRLLAGKIGKMIESFLIKQVQDNLKEIGKGVERYLKERGAPA